MEVRHLRRPFPAATVEFLAHTLCGCPSHPYVASTKILAKSKHHDGDVIFPQAASCLLLACLLAKPVRSTLDTKEGHKTKTSSTSSVTLTLNLTRMEYWDQARGGRNMVLDTSVTPPMRCTLESG